MRALVVLLTGIIFIIQSCSERKPSEKVIHQRIISGEFEAYHHLPSYPCDSLQIDSLNKYRLEDSLYTGICFTKYPNINAKLEIRQIFRGELHGNRMILSPKRDTLSLNLYKHGKLIRKSVGTGEIIHCDSLEVFKNDQGKELRYYFGEPYTGRCKRFYPDGDSTQIYLEASYSKGLPHGDHIIYDRNGNQILKEQFINGEKVKEQ